MCFPRTGTCLNFERHVPVALVDVAGLVPEPQKDAEGATPSSPTLRAVMP